jgi:hypothetical protein
MSIKNPTTYAEWYWANQVYAEETFADNVEKSLDPYVKGLWALVSGFEGIPPVIANMIEAFGTPGHQGLKSMGEMASATAVNGVIGEGLSPFLRGLSYVINSAKPNKLIDLNSAAILRTRNIMPRELFENLGKMHGFDPLIAQAYYRSTAPYPGINDLFTWARYTSNATETAALLKTKTDIVDEDYPLWDFLTGLRLSIGEIQALFVRGFMTEMDARQELARDGYRPQDIDAVLDMAFTIPNPSIMLQDGLLNNASMEEIKASLQIAGLHKDYLDTFINSVLAKPNPSDMVRWRLRTDPNLTELDTDLRKLGIHPDYLPVFRDLAYPVPPVGDMITMAVREAFSPDIAARFGQYEDYPADLTRFAAMNGIDEEWAKRYWAAHWSLPSPQQGFEMFHRGIITHDELVLLMRALDIMPFWRDRLIQAAYRPLTRVDVRRMYALGVLSESEVEKAYRDNGYSEENARRLRDFVVRDTVRSQSGMSVSKIVTAYKNGFTDRNTAYGLIGTLGVRPQNVSEILEAADRQLNWQQTKDAIAAIGNQYKQDILTEQHARDALVGLRLSGDKVNNLIARWKKDGIEAHATLWTKADVVSMLKKKLITDARASQELGLLGFNAERTQVLIKLATA